MAGSRSLIRTSSVWSAYLFSQYSGKSRVNRYLVHNKMATVYNWCGVYKIATYLLFKKKKKKDDVYKWRSTLTSSQSSNVPCSRLHHLQEAKSQNKEDFVISSWRRRHHDATNSDWTTSSIVGSLCCLTCSSSSSSSQVDKNPRA